MLTLKLISEETERVIKGKQNQTRTSKKPNLWLPKWEH